MIQLIMNKLVSKRSISQHLNKTISCSTSCFISVWHVAKKTEIINVGIMIKYSKHGVIKCRLVSTKFIQNDVATSPRLAQVISVTQIII